MLLPQYRSYRDGRKAIIHHKTTLATIDAIEEWSSDKSQSNIIHVKLSSSMIVNLEALEECYQIEKGLVTAESYPKIFNRPYYFFGFMTPVFMLRCSKELPKNLITEPNQ
jgi:hypothetical protein